MKTAQYNQKKTSIPQKLTTTVLTSKTFNFNDIVLAPVKNGAPTKHNIQYRYFQRKNGNRDKILMQTPRLPSPFGLKYNEPMESGGNGNWSISLKFATLDQKLYVEDDVISFAEGTPQTEIDFFNWANQFDEFCRKALESPGVKKGKNVVAKIYKPFIKVTEKKVNNVPTGEYHPAQINLRVASYNGTKLKCINQMTSELSKGIDEKSGLSLITPHSDVICVFTLGRVYIHSDKQGPHCFADRVQYWPQVESDDMVFADEETGEMIDIAKSVEKVEDVMEEFGDGEMHFVDE